MNGSVRRRGAARLLILFPLLLADARAQQTDLDARTQTSVEVLLKRIDELEAAQKKMQQKLDSLTGAAVVATPAAQVPVAPVEPVQVDSSPAEGHALGPVVLRGFTDFGYGRAWFEKLPPGGLTGSTHSFNIGDFDLFTNTRISEHWSVLGEMLVTSDFTNGFEVEMDRLLVSYKPNEYLNIGFGKFNTALGYYPNAFQRARYFQTATSRPIMYGDEDNGGLLPVHNIGITATGKIKSGALGLHWIAEVANGRASRNVEAPLQNFVDEGNGKAVNLAIYARPESLRGFQTGISIYHDIAHPLDLPAIRQDIYTGHIVYVGSKLEFLNEASLVRHAVRGASEVYRSLTGYTQASYAFGKTRPYVRFDYQNVPDSDPIFGHAGRMSGPAFGVYRHISNYVVLKIQYGRLGLRAQPSANDIQGQLALAF